MYVGMQVADHYVEAISYVSGMAELDARSNKTRLSRIKPHQINVSCTFRVAARPPGFQKYRQAEKVSSSKVATRVARWFLVRQKIQIWVNFRGPSNGKRLVNSLAILNIIRPLVHFMAIW
jgi:hypothetical protein